MARPQSQNQYQVQRVPLLGHMTNRLASPGKDQLFYNVVFDIQQNPVTQAIRATATKRGGFTSSLTVAAGGGVGRGIHYWSQTGKTYSVIGNTLYSNTTVITTLATSTGTVWFTENTGDVKLLILCDGVSLYFITLTDTFTVINQAKTKTFDGSSAAVVVVATDKITVTGHGWSTGQQVVYATNGGTVIDGLADTITDTVIKTFDGSDDATPIVDLVTEIIYIPNHGWTTGQRVTYSVGGGTAIGGLTDATQYWVIRYGANHVGLATNRTNAIALTYIDLNAAGTGTTHTLTSTGTTATYYIINVDANTVRLALSLADAQANTYINLLAVGTGSNHTLTSDPNVPTNMTTPVSLDTYLLVGQANTEFIYNANVGDPTLWSQGDFISAEMYPDNIVSLVKYSQYIVALGTYSLEFFYDNANPTGSPLKRTDAIALKAGCAARDSIVTFGKKMIFIGQSQLGGPCIWIFDGLTPTLISSDAVDKILVNEGSNLGNAIGNIIHHKGHDLYLLRLTNRTIVYDCDAHFWLDWSSNSSGTHINLPYVYYTEGANNTILALHTSNGHIYTLQESLNTDDAGPAIVDIITIPFDFGNTHQKRQFRMELITDIESTGTVTYYWSDDNYQTWSTGRTMDITTRPYVKSCGTFRRRAHRFVHNVNAPFRAEAFEIEYSEGSH